MNPGEPENKREERRFAQSERFKLFGEHFSWPFTVRDGAFTQKVFKRFQRIFDQELLSGLECVLDHIMRLGPDPEFERFLGASRQRIIDRLIEATKPSEIKMQDWQGWVAFNPTLLRSYHIEDLADMYINMIKAFAIYETIVEGAGQ